ncbi:MAG TPA: hypothetical protein VK964_10885 [Nocardioidaceae bacterium]|nr:hypothetical protein [Nocardioidaceae bacterium]
MGEHTPSTLEVDDPKNGGKGDAPGHGDEVAGTRWRFASAVEAARHLGSPPR